MDFFKMLNECSPNRALAYMIFVIIVLSLFVNGLVEIIKEGIKQKRKITQQKLEQTHIEKLFDEPPQTNVQGFRAPIEENR